MNVLVAVGGEPSPLAAKRATSTIPIVFGIGGDPVGIGLVESSSRPGGNVTGVTLMTALMEPKRLGLLRELVPGVPLIGVLLNPAFPAAARQLQELEQAAHTIGQPLIVTKASTDEQLDAAFAVLVQKRVGALLVASDPYFDTRRDHIIASAAISITDGYRQYGVYAANILRGTKPADLPVQQVVKFELVINMKTAKALNISISDNLLSLADEVIE